MNSVVAEKTYISTKLGINYADMSSSYLRAETQLTTTTEVAFYLQRGQVQTPLVTERLLNLNDKFVITHLFIGIKQIAADTPTSAQHIAAPIYTWYNPQVFSGANASNVDALYNSNFSFTIDRKQYIPNFPMRAFLRIPQTQTNLAPLAGGTLATPTDTFSPAGQDSFDNGLYGFYPMDPTVINGKQTLDATIQLQTSVAFDDASNSVWAVLEARGYLLVNADSN